MATIKQKQAHLEEQKELERKRIMDILQKTDLYNITLDPLIELYLDAHEIYLSKYEAWRAKAFPETKRHTNKAGATNQTKHPLAQQVETWSLKKAKYLEMLGLSNKKVARNQVIGGGRVEEMDKPPEQPEVDELAAHRVKWGRGAK